MELRLEQGRLMMKPSSSYRKFLNRKCVFLALGWTQDHGALTIQTHQISNILKWISLRCFNTSFLYYLKLEPHRNLIILV